MNSPAKIGRKFRRPAVPRGHSRAKALSWFEGQRELTDRERDEAEDLQFRLYLSRQARDPETRNLGQ